MKLAVFGATGRTGIPLVQQALDEGYQIQALVRNPSKMTIANDRLELIQGDILDQSAVEKTIEGTQAVLCVIGHVKNSPDDLQTRAMENITAAMKKHGISRLVDLTGAGVRDPEDRPKLIDNLVVGALRLLSPKVLEDGKRHVEVIRDSDLDWTIVRAPRLIDGKKKGSYRAGFVGKNSGTQITRPDIADFMLKETTEKKFAHKLPMVSY